MTPSRIFGYIGNGEIEISSFKDEYFDQCERVLQSFYNYENVCIGTEISKPDAVQAKTDLTRLCREVVDDGVSLVARDVKQNKIVGVAFNKIQVLGNNNEPSFFAKFKNEKCKSENARALMQFMIDMDSKCDLFKYFDTNCIFELMFLVTMIPEYGKRTIGKSLTFYSMQLAKEIKTGQIHLGLDSLNDVRPTVISAIFTSNFARKIGFDLGFEFLQETFYTDFIFNGKTFSERVGNVHLSTVLAAKKL